jgi:hypothetical protein
MSELKLQPESQDLPTPEQLSADPTVRRAELVNTPASNGTSARRRLKATRLNMSRDDGFRPFRVY